MTIEIKNLSFSYGESQILHDVNFTAKEGELIAILGPNGAGKSTLFKCILKFPRGYSGDIYFNGKSSRDMSNVEIAKSIAYIPQSCDPVFNYTVKDMVLMGTTASIGTLQMPKQEQVDTAMDALEMLGISHLANRGVKRISGGEWQLAMIARALAQKAKIIIMDEPTANLDYGNQTKVMRMIKHLTIKGYTIIMSTHNPDQALIFADTAFVLKEGRVIADGPINEVMTNEIMQKLYNVDVTIFEHNINGETVKTCVPINNNIDKD